MKKLLDFILKYPVSVFAVLVFLGVVSVYFMNKLTVRSDFTALLPEDFQSVKNLKDVDQSFGGMSHLYLIIHQGDDIQAARRFVDQIQAAVAPIPQINYVIDRAPVQFFKDRMALYMDFEDLKEVDRRVKLSLKNSQKYGTSPIFTNALDLEDPENSAKLDLSDIQKKYQNKLGGLVGKPDDQSAAAEALAWNPRSEGYYYSPEDQFFVVWLKSSISFLDLDANKKLLADVQTKLDELNTTSFGGKITYDFTGSYKTLNDQNAQLKNEIIWVFVVVFGLMALVITLFYRNPFHNVIIGLPLLISTTWSGAITYFLIGHVNVITGFTGFILLGPGSDYAIFLLERYQAERKNCKTLGEALWRTYKSAGRSTFSAFITTLAAFIALLFSKFLGFYEFGLVGSIGLATNYFGIILLFPSLIWFMERFRLFERGRFEWKFLDKFSDSFAWINRSIRHGKTFLGLTFVLVLLGLFLAPRQFQIQYKDTGLEDQTLLSWQLQQKVKQIIGQPLRPPTILAKSYEQELAIVEALQTGPTKDYYRDILYLDKFVPDHQDEKRVLAEQVVENFKKLNVPYDKTVKDMIASVATLRDLPPVTREDLPESLKKVFLPYTTKYGVASAVYVFQTNLNLGKRDDIKKFPELFGAIPLKDGTTVSTTHEAFIIADILRLVESDGPKLVTLIFALLAVSVALDFRSLRKFFINFLPMLMTIPVMTAVSYVLGVRLNVLNVCLIPVIFGVGIDNFLHYYHYHEEHRGNFEKISNDILPSIFMASFTSMIGFGGFVVASTAYLRSMGWLSIIGITLIFLMVAFMFPKWIQILTKKKP